MESKPASWLVVSLGKTLNGTPPPLCGRQVARIHLENGNSQARADVPSKTLQCNSLSREWRINVVNIKNKIYSNNWFSQDDLGTNPNCVGLIK